MEYKTAQQKKKKQEQTWYAARNQKKKTTGFVILYMKFFTKWPKMAENGSALAWK